MTEKNTFTINDRIEMLINERCDGNKAAFAKAIGLSPTGLSNYTGKIRRSKPGIDMFEKIVTTFNVDPMWLLTGQEPQHPTTTITTQGDFSASANNHSDASVIIGDAVLAERLRSMETLLAEKDARIAEKDARIAELKERIDDLKTKY